MKKFLLETVDNTNCNIQFIIKIIFLLKINFWGADNHIIGIRQFLITEIVLRWEYPRNTIWDTQFLSFALLATVSDGN